MSLLTCQGPWPNDTFVWAVTKAVHMALNTPAYTHVVNAWYEFPVYLRDLQFRATYATDTLGVRHASITTKRKGELKVRAHVSFECVAVGAAL